MWGSEEGGKQGEGDGPYNLNPKPQPPKPVRSPIPHPGGAERISEIVFLACHNRWRLAKPGRECTPPEYVGFGDRANLKIQRFFFFFFINLKPRVE